MKKISSYQFIALLLCCKLFNIMTYIPAKTDNGTLVLITLVVTTIIEGVLLIPAIVFYNRHDGKGLLTFASSKSRALGLTLSLLFLLLCLWTIIQTLGDLTFFLQYCFSDTYSAWSVVIVTLAATLYVSQTGLSAVARATSIIVIITLLALAFIFTGFKHHIDFYELNLAVRNPAFEVLKSSPKFIASSKELALFVILLGALKSKPAKTAFLYLGVKLFVSLISALTSIIVLGDFIYLSKLPFFTLSAYSQTTIVEHYEAISMMLWTLCALVKLSVFTISAGHCIHHIFPKAHSVLSYGVILVLAGSVTLPIILDERWESIAAPNTEAIITATLITFVPLCLLLFKRRQNVQEVM
ncbi:MAG: GerAB/ArcD/ProY family transporter [Ruminococcus sp.]|nr:GerAB/ArcD/ProY family transporter [Ruminococcus sp.]